MMRQAGLSSSEVAAARDRRSVKFHTSPVQHAAPQSAATGAVDSSAPPALGAHTLVPKNAGGTHQPPPTHPIAHHPPPGHGDGHQPKDEHLSLQHRAGLLHRPPQMHMQSSYQHDYSADRSQPATKTPILEANKMLMRDGQGQVSKTFAPASTLLPYQAATEYQRNYQRWAIPSQDPSTVPGPQYQEADLALEDISDDDDDVAAAVAPLHHAQAIKPPLSNGHASRPTALTHQPPVASHPVTGGKVSASFDSHPPSIPAPVSVPQNTTAPSQQWHVQAQDTIRQERARRFKTEYQRTFCDSLSQPQVTHGQKSSAADSAGQGRPAWYDQVLELRSKAELYRARSLGTFFSRSYFDQLEKNLADWETDSSASRSTRGNDVQPVQRSVTAPGGQPQYAPGPVEPGHGIASLPMQPANPPGQPLHYGIAAQGTALPATEASHVQQPAHPGGHGTGVPGGYGTGVPYLPHQVSPSEGSIASSRSSTSAASTESQPISVAASSGAGVGGGRVSTPDRPHGHVRHHLDRTTPSQGLLMKSPHHQPRPKPAQAHGHTVTDPMVRVNPKVPSVTNKPLPKAKTGFQSTATGTKPSTSKAATKNQASGKQASCTCGAEIGPGPYHYRYQPPASLPPKFNTAPVSKKGATTRGHPAGKLAHAKANSRNGGNNGVPAIARTRAPLCDSLSSLSSQNSAAAEVLSRAKQRQDKFWGQTAPHRAVSAR